MDDLRDGLLGKAAIVIQTIAKVKVAEWKIKARRNQNVALERIGIDLPMFLRLKKSPFWQLFTHVRPLLNVARAENRIEELESTLGNLKIEHEQTITQLVAEKDKVYGEKREVEAELEMMKSQHNQDLQEIETLNQRLSEQDAKIRKEMEPALDLLKQQIADLHEQINQKDAMVEERVCELKATRIKLEEVEFDRMKLAMQEKLLSTRLEDSEKARELGVKEIESLNASIAELNQTLSGTTNELSNSRARYNDLTQEYSAIKADSLKKLEEYELASRLAKEEINKISIDLESANQHVQKLQTDILDKDQQINQLSEKLSSEQHTNQQLKGEIELLKNSIQELEMTVQTKTQENSKLQSEFTKLEDEHQREVNKSREQSSVIESLSSDLSALRIHSETQQELLQKQRKDLEAKTELIASLREQEASMNEKIVQLKGQVLELEEKQQFWMDQERVYKAVNDKTNNALEKMLNEKLECERQLMEAKEKLETSLCLTTVITKLQEESNARLANIRLNTELERENGVLNERLNAVKSNLDAAIEANALLVLLGSQVVTKQKNRNAKTKT